LVSNMKYWKKKKMEIQSLVVGKGIRKCAAGLFVTTSVF